MSLFERTRTIGIYFLTPFATAGSASAGVTLGGLDLSMNDAYGKLLFDSQDALGVTELLRLRRNRVP